MPIDPKSTATAMLSAAKASLGADWPKVSGYAKTEFKRLAQTVADIAADVAAGRLTEAEGASLLRIHKNTAITVMHAAKGMALVAAEKAINAALEVVQSTINKAAGAAIV